MNHAGCEKKIAAFNFNPLLKAALFLREIKKNCQIYNIIDKNIVKVYYKNSMK